MMMQLWAIVGDSFRDALDRKIFWIMILISVAIAAAMACISFNDRGVDILFGTWTFETEEWSMSNDELQAAVAGVAIEVIADNYLGWIGMILALVATVSTFPSLMEPGMVDVVASKPIDRSWLFLWKYIGAMVFILLQAMIFIGLTFVVMGVRWHCWAWRYLWLVPLIVLLFSYLFAFSALFGVWTRRSLTTLMLTMLTWFFIFLVQTLQAVVLTSPELDKSGLLHRVVVGVQWTVPKTQDIPVIAGRLVGARSVVDAINVETTGMSEEERESFRKAAQSERERAASVNAVASISSSLAVEALVLLAAMWRFRRCDF